jgi:nucleotide-binding universal stress UspA family protein
MGLLRSLNPQGGPMHFEHVLVYTDGRPQSERALRVAASLVKQAGGRLTVLHVAEPHASVPEHDAALDAAFAAGQRDELERLRTLAQGLGVDANCLARTGRPFFEIIRVCMQEGCDLVVKAVKGRGGLGWPLLGSTALHLVRKSPVPVWLVGEDAPPAPRRIMALLASDPASDARQALDRRVLEVACALAESSGAELRVGAAWDAAGTTLLRNRVSDDQIQAYVDGARRQAEEGLGRALEPFGSAVNPARVHLVRGVPYVALVELAARHADLAVVGTTPPSGGAAFLIREEAEEVINRLETSIVAVKPDGFVSPVPAP